MKIWDFDAKMILNVLDDPLDVTHRISELTLQDYTDNRNNYPGQRIQDSDLFHDVSQTMQSVIIEAYPEIYDITEFECCLQHQTE